MIDLLPWEIVLMIAQYDYCEDLYHQPVAWTLYRLNLYFRELRHYHYTHVMLGNNEYIVVTSHAINGTRDGLQLHYGLGGFCGYIPWSHGRLMINHIYDYITDDGECRVVSNDIEYDQWPMCEFSTTSCSCPYCLVLAKLETNIHYNVPGLIRFIKCAIAEWSDSSWLMTCDFSTRVLELEVPELIQD